MKYKQKVLSHGLSLLTVTAALIGAAAPLQAQDKKPNILVIMGDDIGWMQPSCYHRGLMVGETPTLTASQTKARSSWTTSPCRVAPRDVVPLSPACIRC